MRVRAWQVLVAVGLVGGAAVGLLLRPAPSADVESSVEDPELEEARRAALFLGLAAVCAEDAGCGVGVGEEAAQEALRQLAHPEPGFRDDCSGYVSAVYSAIGVPMDGTVVELWDLAVERDALHWDEPRPGDLVFFERTYDRELDERTHIGLVVGVEDDGTVLFAHAGTSSGRTTAWMNLSHPETPRRGGRVLNTQIRRRRAGDPPDQGYLAGELWTAFARVDPDLEWLGPSANR